MLFLDDTFRLELFFAESCFADSPSLLGVVVVDAKLKDWWCVRDNLLGDYVRSVGCCESGFAGIS